MMEPRPELDLRSLIGGHTVGHALSREFYTDPQIFERDMDRILLRHWFCAGHVSSLPRPGNFLVVDMGLESVIIVRTQNDEVKALVNVCRHRGSRVCTERSGKAPAGLLTCPYHAWSYDLNGRLIAARQMPESFDREQYGLKSLAVKVVEGLIFTTFAEHPLDFAPVEQALAATARVHGWARAKVAHRELYSIKANWKLAVENYMECYHCQPAHPDYSKHHALARPAAQTVQVERAGRLRAEALGIFIADVDQYGRSALSGSESVTVFRSALYDSASGGPPAGGRPAPLMGDFTGFDANSTYFDIGPLSNFLAYADHGVIYRFIPRSALHTEMEVIWLVQEDAQEDRDYDVARLTSLWKTTSLEDKAIVEWNQGGVNSRFFEPGPYSHQEAYALRFTEWYLHELDATSVPGAKARPLTGYQA
jgi:phenylpropionate dioxygenase-like ring-hydroxylating dioxygenase large terminal subunit